MLRLIPKPLHQLALKIAHRLRHHWRRLSGSTNDGVSVIGRDFDGQILLVRHSYGPQGWYLPGGGIGRRESAENAARRELLEETACEIEGMTLVGVIEEELSGAPHRAHVFDGTVNCMPQADGREIVEARFFPTHSLPEPLSPRTRARLDLWRARKF
ncbi:NUDIX domain-containing protein [Qipengyuania sp.]|uniref:NUDIX domain-containing protein n=1 Tax=Qipengyuania sp. TaxID=2004515 RepID=UPI003AF8F834